LKINLFNTRNYPIKWQYTISIAIVILVSALSYITKSFYGYKIVALVLLMTVSILGMLFEILPVLISAILSAIIWNFLFIPPIFTFHIDNPEDVLMFLLYIFIALLNAVLTNKIRKAEKKAREKEEKTNTIKLYNTLLNSLSHELRTPLATIVSAIDSLQEQRSKLSEQHQIELLKQIDAASMRLNRQVENLLNMSRLETGMLKPSLDWCDPKEFIHAMIQKISEGYTKVIKFNSPNSLPLIKIDRGLMEQVVDNLLHNAINYAGENAQISIETNLIESNFIISIIDNGKGIPESDLDLIFEKFYRVPQTKAGGCGLGLSIVKGFVEAHHGNVNASNNKSGGACFIINIPVATTYLNKLNNE